MVPAGDGDPRGWGGPSPSSSHQRLLPSMPSTQHFEELMQTKLHQAEKPLLLHHKQELYPLALLRTIKLLYCLLPDRILTSLNTHISAVSVYFLLRVLMAWDLQHPARGEGRAPARPPSTRSTSPGQQAALFAQRPCLL